GKTENLKIWIYAEENGHKIPNMHKAALCTSTYNQKVAVFQHKVVLIRQECFDYEKPTEPTVFNLNRRVVYI
ncbi:hypothetical protein ACJX0J_005765, partial [Zea mays]